MRIPGIGVSEGLGNSLGMTANAVVSGAFFGDKISPMSDSTNLIASVLGVNLFDHIRHIPKVSGRILAQVSQQQSGFRVF